MAESPGFQGVYVNADTLEACRDELLEGLEDWILLGIHLHHPLPTVDGLDINVKASAKRPVSVRSSAMI
jgi:hypothetical protein